MYILSHTSKLIKPRGGQPHDKEPRVKRSSAFSSLSYFPSFSSTLHSTVVHQSIATTITTSCLHSDNANPTDSHRRGQLLGLQGAPSNLRPYVTSLREVYKDRASLRLWKSPPSLDRLCCIARTSSRAENTIISTPNTAEESRYPYSVL